MRFIISSALLSLALAYSPLRPPLLSVQNIPGAQVEDVGEPLFLTPYIEAGDLETARSLSSVDASLLDGAHSDITSYSGFLTVDAVNNGSMFFWFFPAEESPETAPVVIWLQGGPGASSMLGLLKLHGPFLTETDEDGNFGVTDNPFSWHKKHNMIYIDNPVGAGFSYSNKLPEFQIDVGVNLYEMLQQWFKLFPSYQNNDFYTFGESYGGRYVPTIARKIHEENENTDNIKINLAGLGIGDGWMSPYHTARYGNFLYQLGLVDENVHSECLAMEAETQAFIDQEDWSSAWTSWYNELMYFSNKTEYSYYYDIRQVDVDPSEEDYVTFCNLESTRQAIHVGNLDYNLDYFNVYESMKNDFMQTSIHDIEFLLEHHRVLIYDGNFDLIVNHSGVLDMVNDMEWSGKSDYNLARRSSYRYGRELVGYLKKADNLNLLLVRNAGHMVPMSQPAWAHQMIEDFTAQIM